MQITIPEQWDVFDIFFDLASNQWKCWKFVYNYMLDEKGGLSGSTKKYILSTTCITQDLLRYNFLLD